MFACDPSIAFLLFGKQQTAKFSRRMTKNQKGRTTWTMREAFQEVSPCRTTTTSVNSSSPLGAAAGVGDMVWLVAAAAASLSLCRRPAAVAEREGIYIHRRGSRQLPGRSRPAGPSKNLMPPALSDAVEG